MDVCHIIRWRNRRESARSTIDCGVELGEEVEEIEKRSDIYIFFLLIQSER